MTGPNRAQRRAADRMRKRLDRLPWEVVDDHEQSEMSAEGHPALYQEEQTMPQPEWVDPEHVEYVTKIAEQYAGTIVDQLYAHLLRGGADPAQALRLVGPALLLGLHGETALEDRGLHYRTAREIRVKVKDRLSAAGELPEPDVEWERPVEPAARPGRRRASSFPEDTRAS